MFKSFLKRLESVLSGDPGKEVPETPETDLKVSAAPQRGAGGRLILSPLSVSPYFGKVSGSSARGGYFTATGGVYSDPGIYARGMLKEAFTSLFRTSIEDLAKVYILPIDHLVAYLDKYASFRLDEPNIPLDCPREVKRLPRLPLEDEYTFEITYYTEVHYGMCIDKDVGIL